MRMLGARKFAERLHLYVVGDVHFGSAACARERFTEYVARMAADKHARWIGLGDYIEAIAVDDRRFDPVGLDERMRATDLGDLFTWQVDELLRVLAPVRDRCIALLRGNHEAVAIRRTHTAAWWQRLVDATGAPDCGTSCMVDLVVGQRTVRVAAHHGAGAAATDGGRAQRLARFAQAFVADLVLTGHLHAKADTTVVRLAGDRACKRALAVRTRALCCASWYRSYHGHGSYAEERGLPPSEIGAPVVKIAAGGTDIEWVLY